MVVLPDELGKSVTKSMAMWDHGVEAQEVVGEAPPAGGKRVWTYYMQCSYSRR